MTDLRKAAQAAFDCLDNFLAGNDIQQPIEEVWEDLRAALAQPQGEPAVWIQPDHLAKARVAPHLSRVEPTRRCADFVPLYLTPPTQPQGEPVAWMSSTGSVIAAYVKANPGVSAEEWSIPLYAAPPTPAPATPLLDCRTCSRGASGSCNAVVLCIDGAQYKPTNPHRYWKESV